MAGPRALSDIGIGLACLGHALMWLAEHRRAWWRAMIPAAISSVLLLAALVGIVWTSPAAAEWLTRFSLGWGALLHQIVASVVTALLVIAGVLAAVLLFTTLTLTLGGPFYERLSREAEDDLGIVVAPVAESLRAHVGRGVRDTVDAVRLGLLIAAATLVASCIPVVGTIGAPIMGALAGGWLLTLELMAPAAERRGKGALAVRRQMLAAHRPATLGIGTPLYVAMLIPVVAVLVFPVGIVAGTFLVHALEGAQQPTS